ncbi:MAG: PEP-CTERM/exosortase system-associated acyltransferase [Pseudomonadota bacterium]
MSTFKNETEKESAAAFREKGIDPHYFFEQFRFVIAHTPREKQRAFSLRHEVFHEELHYNIGEKTSAPLEKDAHDQNAILCLLQHRESGMDAGCLRVVIIDPDSEKLPKHLPLEEYCGSSLNDPYLHPKNFSKDTLCEVSRLAVHPLFRKKAKPPTGIKDEDINKISSIKEKQHPALIGLSLFLAATAIVGLSQRRHVFAMLEPRFNRLLKASGLHFKKAGQTINYCGTRAAYYIDQYEAEGNLPEETTLLYRYIKEELASQIHEARNPEHYQNTAK